METEYVNRKTQLVTYLQLTIQSLNEDLSQLSSTMERLDPAEKEYEDCDIEHTYTSGQVSATMHILDYVEEIL